MPCPAIDARVLERVHERGAGRLDGRRGGDGLVEPLADELDSPP